MTRLYLSLISALQRIANRPADERGAAAVEYGMLVALIAAAVVTTVALLGPKIGQAFQTIVDQLTANGV